MTVRTKTKSRKTAAEASPKLIGEHLAIDSRVCHGEPTFRGTRIPVETILSYLANGYSLAYVRKSWPEVSGEAIQEVIRLASASLLQRYRTKKS